MIFFLTSVLSQVVHIFSVLDPVLFCSFLVVFLHIYLYCLCVLTERKKESEKLAVVPKKSSARRQKALQTEKVCHFMLSYM